MSEPGATLPVPSEEPAPPRPSRLRRFFLRHLPLSLAALAVMAVLTTAGLYFWASSAEFENMVRKRMVAWLEQSTGGRVEIASFHWRLLHLQADAGGLVIHGTEDAGDAPYARIDRVQVRLSILGFLSPSLRLRDLDLFRPAFHFIVYNDGSTNQPHPRKPRRQGKGAIETLFDAQAGHLSVEQAMLHYENRAAAFDFQNRYALLDLDARDLSLRMSYIPQSAGKPESYRIEAGAADLNLLRGKTQQVHGFLQATLDLERKGAYLRTLRLTSRAKGVKDRTLDISGALEDFAHPRWQGAVRGELDMRLLDPMTGYPYAPEGIARLNLDSAGKGSEFRIDGGLHIDGGSYIGTGVVATGVGLDARIHADARQLLITSIVARLRQGGQMEGEVALEPWLPDFAGAVVVQPAGIGAARAPRNRNAPPIPAPPYVIPVNGKVRAELKDVPLDTLLDMVSVPPFQRLGLDARINGTANAIWFNGDTPTLAVSAALALSPSGRAVPGEVPSSGIVDATYTQRDGAVDLRKLELRTPGSQLEAHGLLGAYPMTSPSSLTVDFHSRNLGEFDPLLRDLGLTRNGRAGTAALPVALTGQADITRASWTGSLVDPRLAGEVKATQLAVELPPAPNGKAGQSQSAQPQFFRLDSLEGSGSYSAARIEVAHAIARQGKAEISVSGSLAAAPNPGKAPEFDANSLLHAHLLASKVEIGDLQPIIGRSLPVSGALDSQIQIDGPVRALGGTGWVELNGGKLWGEPVTRIRAQGTMTGDVVKLASVSVNEAAGRISASGSYDLRSRRFQVDAKGAGIDVARIDWVRRQNLEASGKLGFSVLGSGTLDDPRLEGHATLSALALGGEPLGGLELTARTANRAVAYNLTTRLDAAELSLQGQTALSGDYATQVKVEFSRFNIGALLKLAHVEELGGESALAGTVTLDGPLARLDDFRGDARLRELAVTVAGVHLKSEGGVHATLANGRVNLDPLHVIGEETDLRAQGSLALKDKQQLDFAASGSVNLKLAQTLDPDLTASGTTSFQVEAHGPLKNPGLRGRIDCQNGSLSLEDLPNGLSQIHGTLEFNQNRLEVKSLTAMSGGGLLSVAGYLAYQHGLYADLSVTGDGIRIRYPQGVSSLADAKLRLQGSRGNLLLMGDVLITRFTMSPDLDIAALAAQANAVQTVAPPDAPSNHIRLDVHLVSSPQLNFQNAFAKLAGNVDLRLRGTVASPSLLGRVSITEGSATIAGTRYDLQRGDIFFTNPVRIEPSIDLNATARVEDYDITLGLHGTPQKMGVTYRSDPPLPEADVVALLALGRTENQQRIYTQQQEQSGGNPTDALLGGALNYTVSSRVQKLFGAGSVKVDPNYLGALGNSTSRIIVEEQLGRNLTLTYATNVNTTGQQLIQAEVAINRHVSLLVARDESGVFSMVLKATRRYR
jgi:translocation and assembly module TamB